VQHALASWYTSPSSWPGHPRCPDRPWLLKKLRISNKATGFNEIIEIIIVNPWSLLRVLRELGWVFEKVSQQDENASAKGNKISLWNFEIFTTRISTILESYDWRNSGNSLAARAWFLCKLWRKEGKRCLLSVQTGIPLLERTSATAFFNSFLKLMFPNLCW